MCNLRQFCIAKTLNAENLLIFDQTIERKKPLQKGEVLFKEGDKLRSLYAIRSGTIKNYIITPYGDEQITRFYFAGDLLGFDAIFDAEHTSFSQALETTMLCEIPFDAFDRLCGHFAALRHQTLTLMSQEIITDKNMILLLSKKTAGERLAAFLYCLSVKFMQRGFSAKEFRLTMTRSDIANNLGLTVETISRLLGKFQESNLLTVKGKYIHILDHNALRNLAGHYANGKNIIC